jgi:cytochrome c oxidase cbb3-type subunit 3
MLMAASLSACEREQRRFHAPPYSAEGSSAAQASAIHVGPAAPGVVAANLPSTSGGTMTAARIAPAGAHRYEENAFDVSEGKRLYRWYNCNGCHAAGGGAIGPALMDDRWLYGHEAAQIVATIMQGRPNGMPSFAGRIPEDQAWKIAAYVRSMSGQLRSDVAPSRGDSLNPGPAEQRRDKEEPRPAAGDR